MKRNIAVIFGGQSAEHDVSIITAHIPIIDSLRIGGQFKVFPIYIAKDGAWYSQDDFNDLAFFQKPGWEEIVAKTKPIQLSFNEGLEIIWPGFRSKKQKLDIVFPALHGTFGEDGSLMGLLRMAKVPFVGCDLFASAVAMDKVLTKQVLSSEGIRTVPFVWFTHSGWTEHKADYEKKIVELEFPLFVKPVHLGSSIGISKVKTITELSNAIEVAFHYDDKVLVERSIENLIEVTLPIMGNEELQLGEVERPLNRTELFSFSDKYLSGGKNDQGVNSTYSEIPAKINPELGEEVRVLGQRVYRILGCSGIARIDFLIDSNNQNVYVNEVNTLPGSLYHHNWRKAGISNVDLVNRLVNLAEERFKSQHNITHVFSSEILNKVGGAKTSK